MYYRTVYVLRFIECGMHLYEVEQERTIEAIEIRIVVWQCHLDFLISVLGIYR